MKKKGIQGESLCAEEGNSKREKLRERLYATTNVTQEEIFFNEEGSLGREVLRRRRELSERASVTKKKKTGRELRERASVTKETTQGESFCEKEENSGRELLKKRTQGEIFCYEEGNSGRESFCGVEGNPQRKRASDTKK